MSKCPIPWDKTFDKDKKYIWISETGKNTCIECKSLDGKIFSGDKVPLRPHPNCKCEVKEYSNENKSTTINMSELDNSELTELQKEAEELSNFIVLLQGEIEKNEYLNENNQIKDTLKCIKNDIEKIKSDMKNGIKSFSKVVIENIKNTIREIEINISKICDEHASEFKNILNYISENINKYPIIYNLYDKVVSKKMKTIILNKGKKYSEKYNMPEAYNFFEIGMNSINPKYIKENATVYNSIYDLKIPIMEKLKIIAQVSKENPDMPDCKVYVFKEESSISQKVLESETIKNFFKEKKKEIRLFNTTNDAMLYEDLTDYRGEFDVEFTSIDSDLYSTLHGVLIKNIKMDKNREYITCQIHDYYNFNPDRLSYKGMIGSFLQEIHELTPFYVIINLKIPRSVWNQ